MDSSFKRLRKQELLDTLSELASLLSTGRRIDPNSRNLKMQIEAIQSELEQRQGMPNNSRTDEDNSR